MARRNSYSGRYKLSKMQFLRAKYYALSYNEWRAEYNSIADTARGITYSDMPKGSLNVESPVEEAAIRVQDLGDKLRLIESTAYEAAGDLYPYLIKGVTNEGITFNALKLLEEIPCEAKTYYRIRRRFYFILSQKI